MWAQMISAQLQPGKRSDVLRLFEQLRATEQPDSGLVRTSAFQDQQDPSRPLLVVFDSNERAREREDDPRRTEGLQVARAMMAEMFDGPLEFTDLEVVVDWAP